MSTTEVAIHRLEPHSARGKARLARILEAATELFLEVGYEATSIDAILLRSGGSKSTLYAYFPTKEDLFRSVIDSVVENDVSGGLDITGNARIVLAQFALQRLRVVISPRHRAVIGLVIAERDRFPDLARIYFERGPRKSQRLLAQYLEVLNGRGVLRIDDAAEAAEFFVGMLLQRWFRQILYLNASWPTESELRTRAERVVARFFAAYAPTAH